MCNRGYCKTRATIYRDDDFTLFTCNSSNDIYVGNKDMQYNGECS